MSMHRFALALLACLACCVSAKAHIEIPYTLGKVIADSTNIVVMVVTKVDKQQNLIIYQKLRDVKGKHAQETIKHTIKGELVAGEIKAVMEWAEPGKVAMFFHNGGASETCTGLNWYQAYPQGEWWGMSHGEGGLLRSFAGRIEKLEAAVRDMLEGREVIVTCFANADRKEWVNRKGKMQRCKASMKLMDYNEKRDFIGWGGEDFVRINGMPGFSHLGTVGRIDAEGQSISCIDFDHDGKLDTCIASSSRVSLMQNSGDSFSDVGLPGLIGGCRSAVWGDYNGDGLPDLLLATATGPRLYTNLGKAQFRDDSKLLPSEPCYNLTAAAWLDADGDGQLDIVFANGFHGLRLYRNKCPKDAAAKLAPPQLGDWNYIGPFDNTGGKGFDTAYPPEKDQDLKKRFPGKKDQQVGWIKGSFADGQINNLALFRPEFNSDSTVYLTREIEVTAPTELPVSFGSDDSLVVWLNGEKIVSENLARACAPDQHKVNLKLKPGKNSLLMKVGQGTGDWAFYFAAGTATISYGGWFEDVSASWGLGADGLGSTTKGDTLSVADVNGDGKPDFLYGAEKGLLFTNSGKKFELKQDSGIAYQTGKAGPVFADVNHDGHIDFFVPQTNGKCKLFMNDGTGKFTDVAEKSGAIGQAIPNTTCASWGDFNNDGHLDLFIGCVRGINRYFENSGDGTFTDKSAEIGMTNRIFNTQACALADLNGDGKLDLVLNNEGQDSAILLGAKDGQSKCTPISVQVGGDTVGGSVRVMSKEGKQLRVHEMNGGEGRGGQLALNPRFTLPAGAYRLELRAPGGKTINKDITVTDTPMKVTLDDREPPPMPKPAPK